MGTTPNRADIASGTALLSFGRRAQLRLTPSGCITLTLGMGLGLVIALATPVTVHAQAAAASTQATASAGSFTLEIRAPDRQRQLLEQHLELRRYRQVPDLDEAELERLLVLAERDARQLLATDGFFNPKLQLRIDAAQRPPHVLIAVDPGTQAVVRGTDIDFAGDLAGAAGGPAADRQGETPREAIRQTIREGWSLPAGRGFTQSGWDDAKAAALRTLTAQRYLRGQIALSVADVDAATGEARLGLRLDSGPPFRLGPMVVTGAQRYDATLVQRLARLPEGSEYDRDRIVRSQLRLAGSGYYDSAFIFVDPEGNPDAVPVQVNVREAKLQRLTVGVGLTTDRGPRLSLEHRHNRVPGIGWRADTKVQLDRISPLLQSELTSLPDDDGWRWAVLGRYERMRDNGQDVRVLQTRVGRLNSGERIDRHYYVQYDRADVRDVGNLPPQDTGDGTAVSVNYVWNGRYFNDPVSPTSGWGFGFELGGGVTLSGSRSPFQRTVVRGLYLWPLDEGRIQLRGEAGAVIAREAARVPATHQFRTGGDTSVRGYGYQDIGVVQADGSVRPGRMMVAGGVEWQRPVFRNLDLPGALEHTVFIDSGAVADSPAQMRARTGIGTGVRFLSPIGALQADIAYGLHSRRFRVHLNIGVTF